MEPEERLKAALADSYAIESELGSGGMATVYLAQDLKHDRKVAVKVLKPELAAVMGTERFLAEIRTTANLQHPHILPLFDSGEADGFLFYVMPYVEGESLKEKLERDGQLPVEEAVRIAGHVADALDHAHRHSVIHRDIKPANVLFHEGEPVVSDFGIALAVSAAGEGRLTETGLSLGTPYYMSPEQAAGDQTPTAASDVYSLGCVLYEMLTGEPPHTGASAQAILGKILLADVIRPTKLRRTIPANVDGAVLKALERLPADRFESASELTEALRNRAFRHGAGGALGGLWNWLTVTFAMVAVLAVVAALTGILGREPPRDEVQRQRIFPPGNGPVVDWARWFALAPDGSSYVYRDTADLESGYQLWVKERESAEGRPLFGTTNAEDVVYSPDGRWIAYRLGNDLIKHPIDGAGTPLFGGVGSTLAAIDWLADETLLIGRAGNTLVRIPADASDPAETVFVFSPHQLIRVRGLPGEESALAVACLQGGCEDGSVLYAVDLQADTAWTIQNGVLDAWYVPTGHVVWVRRDGTVFATSFDLDRLQMADDDQPLFDGVRVSSSTADMELGKDGTVLFVQGIAASAAYEPVWVDRGGREEVIDVGLPGDLGYPAISPDDSLLALEKKSEEGSEEVWIANLERGSSWKLTTFGDGRRPTWTPDGEWVTFNSRREGGYDLWTKRADGSGNAELELDYEQNLVDGTWSHDRRWLIVRTGVYVPGTGDILAWQAGGDTMPVRLAATQYREVAPALSPNDRFLAFNSNESGWNQVIVVPFPDVGAERWFVSPREGIEPVWSKDGRELFYRKGTSGDLVAVAVETEGDFRIGEERVLFPAGAYLANSQHPQYDVSLDGQRFLMLRPVGGVQAATDTPVIQVLNWFTELEERVGGGG
jgi:serine/threonine-protein kinase